MTFWSFLRNLSSHGEPEMPPERIEAERERHSWSNLEQLQEILHDYSGYFRGQIRHRAFVSHELSGGTGV